MFGFLKNKIVIVVVALVVAWQAYERIEDRPSRPAETYSPVTGLAPGSDSLARAFESRSHGVQVEGQGVVTRVLPDDAEGSRHQRFLVRLPSGQTVLIAHNIDLAPRIEGIVSGSPVSFSGEYEWNERGGVVHWTHRDPQGQHVAGWLKFDGRTYQ
jgi:hypothetical protein